VKYGRSPQEKRRTFPPIKTYSAQTEEKPIQLAVWDSSIDFPLRSVSKPISRSQLGRGGGGEEEGEGHLSVG
jgi:hypothetical protein